MVAVCQTYGLHGNIRGLKKVYLYTPNFLFSAWKLVGAVALTETDPLQDAMKCCPHSPKNLVRVFVKSVLALGDQLVGLLRFRVVLQGLDVGEKSHVENVPLLGGLLVGALTIDGRLSRPSALHASLYPVVVGDDMGYRRGHCLAGRRSSLALAFLATTP